MRYRLLLLFPLAWTACACIAWTLASGTPAFPLALRVELEAVKLLALWGAWAAALRFQPGEYPRRAWVLIGACMALLLLRDLTLLPAFDVVGERPLAALRGGLVTAGNLSQVAGVWLLARSWKVADLSLPGTRGDRWLVLAVAVALATAFAGPSVVTNSTRVLAGELGALTAVASSLGDMLSLCLIAPLLLTALALRGGLIGWPWALLTTSYVAWLLYDAVLVYGPSLGADPATVRLASEVCRALGCTYGFSAGLAQRAVVDDMLRPAAALPA